MVKHPGRGKQCRKHYHRPEEAREGAQCKLQSGAGAVGGTWHLRGMWLMPGTQWWRREEVGKKWGKHSPSSFSFSPLILFLPRHWPNVTGSQPQCSPAVAVSSFSLRPRSVPCTDLGTSHILIMSLKLATILKRKNHAHLQMRKLI